MARVNQLLRGWVGLALTLTLLLAACGAEQATPAPTPKPVKAETKTDSLLADLLLRYHTASGNGLEAARQLAQDSGLLDSQDNLRFGLTLDKRESLAAVQAKLQQLGAKVSASYEQYLTARVSLPQLVQNIQQGNNFWDELNALTAVRDLKILIEPPNTQVTTSNPQGLAGLGVSPWQQLGYKGKGVKVGVIDSGFSGYQSFVGTALPASNQLTFNSFLYGGGEGKERHGVAVSEIVHSLAPDASLYLAPIEDEVSFAQAVDWLLANKVQIIQISLAWGGLWPSDGNSLLSKKLEEARNRGALPIVAVGNYAKSHYRGTFQPDINGYQQFGTSLNLRFTPNADSAWVSLRWEENWDAPITNLDLYILDENRQPLASSRNIQGEGSQKHPVELAPFRAKAGQTAYIQVRSANPQKTISGLRFDLFAYNANFEENTPSESVATPGDARGAIAVGAVDDQETTLQDYSSRGPTIDGRTKPDLVAPGNASLQSWPLGQTFSGTSAAAPQVSGLAAIIWGVAPSFNADQVEKYLRRNVLLLGKAELDKPDPGSGYGGAKLGPIEDIRGGPAEMLGAIPSGSPLKDSFGDNRGGLPDNVLGYYGKLPDGTNGYFVRVGEPNEINWSVYTGRTFEEFRAEFTAEIPGLNRPAGYFYGLVFWQKSQNEYYLFCVSENRFAVLQRNGNVWREIVPWSSAASLNSEQPVRLSLEATAGYIRIKANSTILQSMALDKPQIGGKIGFASGSFGFVQPIKDGAALINLPLAMFTELVITPLTS